MKVRASERDASSLAIAQRAKPKFDEVKDESLVRVESGKMKDEPLGRRSQSSCKCRRGMKASVATTEDLSSQRSLKLVRTLTASEAEVRRSQR